MPSQSASAGLRRTVSGGDISRRSSSSNRRARNRAKLALLLVALLAALVLFVTILAPGPTANTLPYEVARTSLQVLGVVLVGAFVGMATFSLQQEQQRTVDERRRLDDRVRAVFDETVDAYNEVKLVRRLLRAETGPKEAAAITRRTYTRLLSDLCKQQLAFEDLKRSAPLFQVSLQNGHAIAGPVRANLTDTYDAIEHYLNEIVEEYEKTRHCMPPTGAQSLYEPNKEKLREFVYNTAVFRAKVSDPVEAVLQHLERHLLTSSR